MGREPMGHMEHGQALSSCAGHPASRELLRGGAPCALLQGPRVSVGSGSSTEPLTGVV